jgi:hypothetical protein
MAARHRHLALPQTAAHLFGQGAKAILFNVEFIFILLYFII